MNQTVPPQYLTLPVLTERVDAPVVEPPPEPAADDSNAVDTGAAEDAAKRAAMLLIPVPAASAHAEAAEGAAIDAGALQALIRAELEALLPEMAERIAQGVFRGFRAVQPEESMPRLPQNDE